MSSASLYDKFAARPPPDVSEHHEFQANPEQLDGKDFSGIPTIIFSRVNADGSLKSINEGQTSSGPTTGGSSRLSSLSQ
jgi:hypothetical protein